MKRREINELRTKSKEELTELAEKTRLEITKAKAYISALKEKNLKKVKNLRHDLAQILSILREKDIIEKEGGEER